ncbi:MAG: tRNA (adenosine(37)-N6)-threonylcarbamoyltransferase complex ATPase subunit type 1 TsaE [Oscillatoriales cyanobacterium CG2_30_44_21]|nr:MAG: tRNA (adenosine(37)-N6)-threonylcarbamoyltransferase complex ATPase subunit type 1 TsaE [Oscillatoriales cyanobacterium CG2_30_44_21]
MTEKIELYTHNLDVTQAIAAQLAQLVSAGTIILLEGNLGSGKTTFMQAFGVALGISTTITSPTFTLIDEYIEGRIPLYHIDLYRLEPAQIPSLHLEEYWRGDDIPLGVVAIEWASKLAKLPSSYLKINLSHPERSPFHGQQMDEEIENLPSDRLIQIVAEGAAHLEILKNLAVKKEILKAKLRMDF